jgi:CRP-like cAMP-binding protein
VEQELPAGSTLFRAGSPATLVWFVKAGTVWRSPRDRLQGPGAFLGLEAIVNDRYVETAIAESDVTVCAAPAIVVDGWLGDPDSPSRTALEQLLLGSCREEPR